jgi:hypothetical protein
LSDGFDRKSLELCGVALEPEVVGAAIAALTIAGGPGTVEGVGFVDSEMLASSGLTAVWNMANESRRSGSAPGKRTVCGFMCTPFSRYSQCRCGLVASPVIPT